MSTRGEKRGKTKRREERRERRGETRGEVRSDTCVAERVEPAIVHIHLYSIQYDIMHNIIQLGEREKREIERQTKDNELLRGDT